MDFIKAEIESKKRLLSSNGDSTAPPQKYVKRGDLERQRIESLQQEQSNQLIRQQEQAAKLSSIKGKKVIPKSGEISEIESFNVGVEEAIRRLRAKGQPIRLFGESDKERRLRLRALELIEERSTGQRNEFAKVMDGVEIGLGYEEVKSQSNDKKGKKVMEVGPSVEAAEDDDGGNREKKPREESVLVDVSLVKSNPHKIYPQIFFALKRILAEWEQSMNERSEEIRRSTQGKIAAATQQSSGDYLKPLFKSLRKRDLAPDVLLAIAEITYNMQIREYLKANDAYLKLSIGNAPWPIGVTMVGIHERSGREKIFSNNVAHVLNDETSRKYIQSLKRLLTFAQTKYPPDDLSQKMG